MPLICEECGSTNRAKAKFCAACAARLRAVEPSGISAPAAVEPMASTSIRGAPVTQPAAVGPAQRLLPAEMPGFWLRLIALGVALTVGFMAWYLYVTREVATPPPRTEVAATEPAKPAAVIPPTSATDSPVAHAKPTPTAAAVAPAPQPAAVAPAAPQPAAAPASEAPATDASQRRPRQPSVQPRAPSVETRATVRTPRPAAGDADTSAVSRGRSLALARELNEAEAPGASGSAPQYRLGQTPSRLAGDPGPPIAVGPGPRYNAPRAASRFDDDPGPPVVPGPGPLYDASRASPRIPATVQPDPGPPIAVGPGPLVDYSSRPVRPR